MYRHYLQMLTSPLAQCASLLAAMVLGSASIYAQSSPSVVYDSLSQQTFSGGSGYNNLLEVGDSVQLSAADLAITQFDFAYTSVSGDVTYIVKFYKLDGPNGAPGTLIWQSPEATAPATPNGNPNAGGVTGIPVPTIAVPQTFAWTIFWTGAPSGQGLTINYGAGPFVGQVLSHWFLQSNNTWISSPPGNGFTFAAQMHGVVAVPFACTISPAGTAIPGAPVSWNKFSAGFPDVVWVNAHIGTPSGVPTTSVTTVEFTGVTLTVNNTSYALPNGTLKFDPSAPATPTTTFDPTTGWATTVNPKDLSDEIFFAGQALPIESNLTGGGKATLSFTTQSTVNSLAFNWQWSAAAYTFWPDNTQAGILAYHDSLQAGSPLNTQVQQSLINGPRGGGGSNYTGSWSGTGQGACSGGN